MLMRQARANKLFVVAKKQIDLFHASDLLLTMNLSYRCQSSLQIHSYIEIQDH